jgi:hypothetical protein
VLQSNQKQKWQPCQGAQPQRLGLQIPQSDPKDNVNEAHLEIKFIINLCSQLGHVPPVIMIFARMNDLVSFAGSQMFCFWKQKLCSQLVFSQLKATM